jgi:hypothetical protein
MSGAYHANKPAPIRGGRDVGHLIGLGRVAEIGRRCAAAPSHAAAILTRAKKAAWADYWGPASILAISIIVGRITLKNLMVIKPKT